MRFHPFKQENLVKEVTITFDSDSSSNVYAVKSRDDYVSFADGYSYESYSGCTKENAKKDSFKCTVSSGGIIVENNNNRGIKYTIGIN